MLQVQKPLQVKFIEYKWIKKDKTIDKFYNTPVRGTLNPLKQTVLEGFLFLGVRYNSRLS